MGQISLIATVCVALVLVIISVTLLSKLCKCREEFTKLENKCNHQQHLTDEAQRELSDVRTELTSIKSRLKSANAKVYELESLIHTFSVSVPAGTQPAKAVSKLLLSSSAPIRKDRLCQRSKTDDGQEIWSISIISK